MVGRVVSAKLQKTVTVLVERIAMHPLYKKTFKRSKKYLAHDPLGVKEGDVVEIIKVRPLSKNKHWQITKVVGKNLAEIAESELKQAAEETIAEAMPAGRQVMPEEKVESSDKSQESGEEAKPKKARKKGQKTSP